MTEIDIEALAEAMYLHFYPRHHQGAPAHKVWLDLPLWQREFFRNDAKELVEMYRHALLPVEQRTVKLRDISPELYEKIWGATHG
jgi:hypothetical protein